MITQTQKPLKIDSDDQTPLAFLYLQEFMVLEMAVHKVWCMDKRTEVTIFDKSENSLFQIKLREQVLTTMAKID